MKKKNGRLRAAVSPGETSAHSVHGYIYLVLGISPRQNVCLECLLSCD